MDISTHHRHLLVWIGINIVCFIQTRPCNNTPTFCILLLLDVLMHCALLLSSVLF